MEFFRIAWASARKVFVIALVAVAVAAGVYSTATSPKIQEAELLQSRLERTALDVDRLKRDNRRLKLLILNMSDSRSLAEKVAREDAGMIKEGEILYLFPR